MSTEPVVIQNGNITIIDPNPPGHTINHEDMYIYASLVAKTRGRTFLTQNVDNSYQPLETVDISTVDLVISDSATQEGLGKRKFLTTNWTEIGGSQFKDTNVSGDLEGFGITNVDIEIKGSYIPKVVIDFVDIRGATLFEQGSCSPYALFFHLPYPIFELTVKGYYGKPITYYLNLVKFNTKFNSQTGNFECRGEFIGWSYAFLADILMGFVRCAPYMDQRWNSKGILRDKYDEAVKYYIDNGLYDETDYYQESGSGDVTLQSDAEVRQPFCEQGDGGTVNCITLSELHRRIKDVEDFLAYAKGDDDYQNLANLVSVRTGVQQLLNDIRDFARELQDDGYVEKSNVKVGNHPNRQESKDLFIFNGPPSEELRSILKNYWERYISGNEDSGLGVFARQTASIKDEKISDTECGGSRVAVFSQVDSNGGGGLTNCTVVEDDETFKYQFLNGLNNSGVYFQKGMLNLANNNNELNYVDQDASTQPNPPGDYYIDLGWYIYPIEEDLKKLDEEISKQRNAVKEAIDKGVTQKLGFRPTIRNVFTILSCNVETLVQLLLNCCIEAEQHHNDNQASLNNSYGGSSTDKLLELKNRNGDQLKQIYPWPTYYKEDYRSTTTYNQNDSKKETKEVYPGENTDFFDWPEVRFVEDFIKACEKLNEDDETLAEDLTGVPGFDNYIPINPLESRLTHNGTELSIKYLDLMSSDLDGKDFNSVLLQYIGERMFVTLDFTHFDPVRYNPFNIGMGFSAPQKKGFSNENNLDALESISDFNKRRLWMGGTNYYKIDSQIEDDPNTPITVLASIDAHNLLSCIDDKKIAQQINLIIKQGKLSDDIARVFKKISENRTEPNSSNRELDWFNENYDYKSQTGGYTNTTNKILENNLTDIPGWEDTYWAYHPQAGHINFLGIKSRGSLGDKDDPYGVRIYTDISQMRPEYLFQMWEEDERSGVRKMTFNDKPDGEKDRKDNLIKGLGDSYKNYLKDGAALKATNSYIFYSKNDDHKLNYFDGSNESGKGLFTTLNIGQSAFDDTQGIPTDPKFSPYYACLPLFVANTQQKYRGQNIWNISETLLSNYLAPCGGNNYFVQTQEGESAWNFTTEISSRGIFLNKTAYENQAAYKTSVSFGDASSFDKDSLDWQKLKDAGAGDDAREGWGDTITYETMIMTPLWLDNVNRFREATTHVKGSGQNLSALATGYGRPLTTTSYPLKGPVASTIDRPNDYTSEEIESRNLAYLFLASCKTTPFITAGARQNNDAGDAVFNYINEHYPKALIPFALSAGLIKVPKVWVYGIGSVLWRWKMYMGVNKDANGNIRWRHPNFEELPIGFDPLAQPGHPSQAVNSLENKNNIQFGVGICDGCGGGRRNRSTTREFTLNSESFETYENLLYKETPGRQLWTTRHDTKVNTQLSCFVASTTRWLNHNRGFYDANTADNLSTQLAPLYGTLGYNFDYWGVYNNDEILRKTRPQSWTNKGGGFIWTQLYWSFVYDDPMLTDQVNSYIYEDFLSYGLPQNKQIENASEASRYTYWPILFITPWQHFYTEAVSANGNLGYVINDVQGGTNKEGYNTQVEKTLTLIPSDMPFRDYVGNFGHLGSDNSNFAGGFSTTEKYAYRYDINNSFLNKSSLNYKKPEKEVISYTDTTKFWVYGCEINGTDVKNWFTIDGGKYSELIALLPTFVKERFVEEFEKWCDGEWKNNGLKIIDPVNFGQKEGDNLIAKSYGFSSFYKKANTDGYSIALNQLIGGDAADSTTEAGQVDNAYSGVIALDPQITEVKDFFESIFGKYYQIMVSTPKLFGLDVYPGKSTSESNNKSAFMANKVVIEKYLEAFQKEWNASYKAKEEQLSEDAKPEDDSVLDDSDTKLSLYRTFKSICDKWISSSRSNGGKNTYFFNITDSDVVGYKGSERVPLAGHFTYVNRVMGEIGNKAVLDVTKLKSMKDNPKISFYNQISDLLGENKFDFFPLPSFTNFTGDKNGDTAKVAREMFSPFTDNIVKASGPNFICMYVGGTSRMVDLKPKPNCPKDQEDMDYNDDGFPLSEEGAETPYEYQHPSGDDVLGTSEPSPNKYEYKDNSRIENQGFTAFRVAYGLENQNHFKSVELDQTEFTETNESLLVIEKLADGGNPANRTQKGNNLHNIYLTRSYTCKVGSLGNMMIQPLQYFELSNIPMFYGTYLITEVSHNIKPHHIETNFKGVRQPIATVPVVEDVAIAMSDTLKTIEAKTGRNDTLVLDTTTLDDCDVFGGGDSDISFGSSDVNQKGCAIAQGLVSDVGLTLEQACGVVGNLIRESGLRPAIVQCSSGNCPDGNITESGGWNGTEFPSTCVDPPPYKPSLCKGYGWAQWTYYNLKNDFITHAKAKGVDLTTTNATDEINFSYLKEWLKTSWNGTNIVELKKAKTVEEATVTFALKYERCDACKTGEEKNKRVNHALAVFGACKSQPVDNTQASGAGKNWKPGSNEDAKCPAGFTDAGVEDGYNNLKRYRIKLCKLNDTNLYIKASNAGKVNAVIAENTLKMLKDANAAGVPLKAGSVFRTMADQKRIGKDNGCPDNWTRSGQCKKNPTAPAGKSNHQMGVAIDFACGNTGTVCHPIKPTSAAIKSCPKSNGKKCLDWLLANANKYDFYNYEVEPWHWSINGG
jgi:hypothetical protein